LDTRRCKVLDPPLGCMVNPCVDVCVFSCLRDSRSNTSDVQCFQLDSRDLKALADVR